MNFRKLSKEQLRSLAEHANPNSQGTLSQGRTVQETVSRERVYWVRGDDAVAEFSSRDAKGPLGPGQEFDCVVVTARIQVTWTAQSQGVQIYFATLTADVKTILGPIDRESSLG